MKYIDADALIEHLEDNLRECGNPDMATKPITYGFIIGLKNVLSYAQTLPTTEVVEVRHGEWKRVRWVKCDDPDGGYWIVRCNQCGIPHIKEYKFCPSCGAKMNGKNGGDI